MSAKPFHDLPFLARPSVLGMLIGALAFTAALTPSLIPRTGPLQGVVAGLAFALLYGLTVLCLGIWRWLGLPVIRSVWVTRITLALAALIMLWGLAQATAWQNQIHAVMDLPPVETARPAIILATSLAVILLTLAIGRVFRRASVVVANQLARFLPLRVAMALGLTAASILFWSIGSGVLLDGVLRAMDNTYRQLDALIPTDQPAPTGPLKSGSPASLVDWQGLGAQGRNRVIGFPDAATISKITDQPALEPLRVYVGLNNAESPAARADLALAELIRIGGFDRKLLVIATPTGTGWIDPASMTPLEFLWGGDVASVSVQYSYLPSWLSLIVQPEYGEETAHAVFRRVYDHWRQMPRDARPRLYLHGLSLGSLNSDLSLDVFDMVGDPVDGAFWVGPPFASRLWPRLTATRNPDSPAWSPTFRDGAFVRFTTQTDTTATASAPWGHTRMLYLQYPSDAISFFEPASLFRAPDWMAAPRGPDVSPGLRWMPVVTFLQLLTDMMTATLAPTGHGHVYAARDYMAGWVAVTEPPYANAATLEKLRAWFVEQGI